MDGPPPARRACPVLSCLGYYLCYLGSVSFRSGPSFCRWLLLLLLLLVVH